MVCDGPPMSAIPRRLCRHLSVCGVRPRSLGAFRFASSVPPIDASAFARLAPMVFLRASLASHASVVSEAEFSALCAACHVPDAPHAARLLSASGVLVPLAGGSRVWRRPALLLAPAEWGAEAAKRVARAEAERSDCRRGAAPHTQRARRWRRNVWAAALLWGGAQLAVIARLTYVDLDWDIMEPVSYFLGTGTSLLFFMYFMRYGRSHTYTDFDRAVLPRKLRQYAPSGFDWERYEKAEETLRVEKEMLEKIQDWARRN